MRSRCPLGGRAGGRGKSGGLGGGAECGPAGPAEGYAEGPVEGEHSDILGGAALLAPACANPGVLDPHHGGPGAVLALAEHEERVAELQKRISELERESAELSEESLELASCLNAASKEAEMKDEVIERLQQEVEELRGGGRWQGGGGGQGGRGSRVV